MDARHTLLHPRRRRVVLAALAVALVLVGEVARRGASAAGQASSLFQRPPLVPAFGNSLTLDDNNINGSWDGVVRSSLSRVRGILAGGDGTLTSDGLFVEPGALGGYILIAGLFRELNPTRGQWAIEATVRPDYTVVSDECYDTTDTRLEVYERHQAYWMNLRTDVSEYVPLGTVRCGFTWANGTIFRADANSTPVPPDAWTSLRCALEGSPRALTIEVNGTVQTRVEIGPGEIITNPETPLCIGCKYRAGCNSKGVCKPKTQGHWHGAIRDVYIKT